ARLQPKRTGVPRRPEPQSPGPTSSSRLTGLLSLPATRSRTRRGRRADRVGPIPDLRTHRLGLAGLLVLDDLVHHADLEPDQLHRRTRRNPVTRVGLPNQTDLDHRELGLAEALERRREVGLPLRSAVLGL